LYFFSCQLFTTAPRFETTTRYKAFSTTMLCSWVSPIAADAVAGAAETAEGALPGTVGVAVAGVFEEDVFPGVAGAVRAGLFGCGTFVGGLGAKYFVQARNTTIDSNEATRIRSSGVNLSLFFPPDGSGVIGGVLTDAPREF
jgi:hypothetical protein